MPKEMTRSEARELVCRFWPDLRMEVLGYDKIDRRVNVFTDEGLISIVEPPTLLQAAKALVDRERTTEAKGGGSWTSCIAALRDAIAREEQNATL